MKTFIFTLLALTSGMGIAVVAALYLLDLALDDVIRGELGRKT